MQTNNIQKSIQCDLWLSKIVYSGDNIGHDFIINFSLGNKSCSITLNGLLHDETNDVYKLLFSDEYALETTLPLTINITEKDDIPDLGNGSINITLAKHTGIAGNIKIKIKEQGPKGTPNSEATLNLYFLTRTYELGIKSLTVVDSDGWIVGYYIQKETMENLGSKVSFPYGLKVRIFKIIATHSSKGFEEKEYFEILEGHQDKGKNKYGRLIMPKSAKSRFSTIKYEPSAKLEFIITKEKYPNYQGSLVVYSGNTPIITVNAITAKNSATLPKGTYELEIPDEPHKGGLAYQFHIPHAKSWFRIHNTKEKDFHYYLHYGEISAGCVTVTEKKNNSNKIIDVWEPIYQYLITRRNRNKNGIVGTIKITYKLQQRNIEC